MSRPYVEVLRDLAGGEICAALDRHLADCTAAVLEHHGTASLKLELKIKPNGEATVEVVPVITAKLPPPARPRTMMFVDAEHGLRREDPRQAELQLRSVGPAPAEPKVIDRDRESNDNAPDQKA